MADHIVLLATGDADRARQIIRAFADRTGLSAEERPGGVRFALGPNEHRLQIVEILTDIDAQWTQHLSLGDPAAT